MWHLFTLCEFVIAASEFIITFYEFDITYVSSHYVMSVSHDVMYHFQYVHLFCDCVKYMSLRNNMYQYIFNSNLITFNSQKELFIQLMTSTDEAVLRSLGVFINACNIS